MPSASAIDVEKAKPELTDSCSKLCIKFLEHKIRNLEKRKGKLESYRQLKTNGKKLENEQILAISKYEEVSATLDFARDVVKTMLSYAAEAAQEQKEASEKEQERNLSKIKLVLELQDILAQLQLNDVKQNFINGENGAAQISEERLGHLEAFYKEIYPESTESEDVTSALPSRVKRNNAAQHIQNFSEAKPVAVVGTTYEELKKTVDEIKSCDYFSEIPVIIPKIPVVEVVQIIAEVEPPATQIEPPEVERKPVEPVREIEPTPYIQQNNIPVPPSVNLRDNNSFYSDPVPAAVSSQYLAKKDVPVQPLSGITSNSAFNFLQESELDSPETGLNVGLGVTPTPPPASALPIPSQTFTNPHYIPPPPIPMPPSHLQQPQSPSDVISSSVPNAPVSVNSVEQETPVTNWNESWAAQSEPAENDWGNDNWGDNSGVNDSSYQVTSGMSDWNPPRQGGGFVTQGRSNYRGSSENRGRGRQPRGSRGGRGRGSNAGGPHSNSNDYSSRKSDGGYQNTNGYLGKGNSEGSGRGNGYSRRGGGASFNNRSSSSGFRRGNDRGERGDRSDRNSRGDKGDRPERGDRMERNGSNLPRKGSGNYGSERGSYANSRGGRSSTGGGRGRNVQNSTGYV